MSDKNGFTLASGQKLKGGGTVVGGLILSGGGVLAPGASPGTLTVASNMTWGGGGVYEWEVQNWTGIAGATNGWDLIKITSGTADPTLDITATSGDKFVIKIQEYNLVNVVTNASKSFTILQADSAITGFSADKFTLDTTGWSKGGTWEIGQVGNNDITLTYIPEPGTMLMLGIGGAVLAWRRRRFVK